MKKTKLGEILFPSLKILIVFASIILVIFLAKYFYGILNNIFEIKPPVSETEGVRFEMEKLEKFLPRLGIEIEK